MSEQKMNIDFVKEVEKHPCIYDYRRTDYARKDETKKAWTAVGEKFDLSGPQCRERWKNLRTVLSRNLRPNGTTRASKQRKPYYLFEAMKFAIPFIKTQNTVPSYFRNSQGDQESEEPSEAEDGVQDAVFHITVESDAYLPSRTPSPQYSSPPPSPQIDIIEPPSLEQSNVPHKTPQATKRPRETMDTNTAEADEILESLNLKKKRKKLTTTQNPVKKTKNLDLAKISKKRFLLSLLSDVYAMDDFQMRSFRIKVLQLIDEVSQGPRSGNMEGTNTKSCNCTAASAGISSTASTNINSAPSNRSPSASELDEELKNINRNSIINVPLIIPKQEKPNIDYDEYF